ncbi:MAG: rod shape-determining protein MreC [Deltaproteobacteria bacterium]|nr:rod shape-determining protein MreC [Deltaproteobacteria bacterium]
MREFLARNRFGVTVGVLLVVPLILMYQHGRRGGGSAVETASTGLAGLVQAGVGALVAGGAGFLEDYFVLVDVAERNQSLAAENERLVGEALLGKRLAVENEALRKLLGLRQARKELKMAPAGVVGRELTPFYRVARLSIDLDGDAAPAPDMAVVTHAGLVGRIVRTAGRYADVMLLTDTRSRVACEVLGRGVLGTLVGTGTLDEYRARLQVSVIEAPLEKDAVVVTSGHDRVLGRGIEAGYVADPSKRRQAGPFVEYDVVLAVNPAAIDDAMVVLEASAAPPPARGR